MAREFFQPTKFDSESLNLVATLIQIVQNYAEQGFDLSLRQLYYQCVSQNIIENTERSYKRIGNLVNDARLAGYIDWNMIVDRGRDTNINPHWKSPNHILKLTAEQYAIDLWEDQPTYLEVMVEKQALEGVLAPVCAQWDVPFSANKGYSSASAMYQAGKRINKALKEGKHVTVLYLGDHDPSGIDMTRDVEERLMLFSSYRFYHVNSDDEAEIEKAYKEMQTRKFKLFKNAEFSQQNFNVRRIALNMPQIDEYNPPPNPAKLTDSRATEYVRNFGYESWELDALEPSVLASLVSEQIEGIIWKDAWDKSVAKQTEARKELLTLAESFGKKQKKGGDNAQG